MLLLLHKLLSKAIHQSNCILGMMSSFCFLENSNTTNEKENANAKGQPTLIPNSSKNWTTPKPWYVNSTKRTLNCAGRTQPLPRTVAPTSNSNNNTVTATATTEMDNARVWNRQNQIPDIVVIITRVTGFHRCNPRVTGMVGGQQIETLLEAVDMPLCRICRKAMGRFRRISISRVAGIPIITTIAVVKVIGSIEAGKTGGINSLKGGG